MKFLRTAFTLLLVAFMSSCSSSKTGRFADAPIRVMAYNIHHANPPSKPALIDIDAIARAIKDQDPDLVALQEVDVNTQRSGKFNQAEEIARRLGMSFFFAKAIDHGGGDYGVAILSKFPMSETAIHSLPTEPNTKGEPRVLATAKISLPGGIIIRFGSTHLDAQPAATNRELQINEISRIAAAETLPFIIAGDFNAEPGSSVIDALDRSFTRTCQECEFTIPVINPNKTIDFVAFAPKTKFTIVSTRAVPEKYASDHLPVIAILKFKTPGQF